MQKFIFRIVLFSLFLAFALFGVNYLFPGFALVPFYFVSIGYFMLLTLLVYKMLVGALKKDNKQFVYAFYITTLIRLFGSIIVLLIYFLLSKERSLYEAVVFIVLYFLYTGFEIVNLFPTLRPQTDGNSIK